MTEGNKDGPPEDRDKREYYFTSEEFQQKMQALAVKAEDTLKRISTDSALSEQQRNQAARLLQRWQNGTLRSKPRRRRRH